MDVSSRQAGSGVLTGFISSLGSSSAHGFGLFDRRGRTGTSEWIGASAVLLAWRKLLRVDSSVERSGSSSVLGVLDIPACVSQRYIENIVDRYVSRGIRQVATAAAPHTRRGSAERVNFLFRTTTPIIYGLSVKQIGYCTLY